MNAIIAICFFTLCIHFSETLSYGMRLAGLRTRRIAISLSFVTSTLMVSRLSNLFQAPLLGAMVDKAVMGNDPHAVIYVEHMFRLFIFCGFAGSLIAMFFTPTMVSLFQAAIVKFEHGGSLPGVILSAFKPRSLIKFKDHFRLPSLAALRTISWRTLPKGFLIMNVVVTSVYAIGVLCSLLASAYLPEMRSTANQLSGIVNGIATILLTMFVDPGGARITDQAFNEFRPENDVRSVVFFLQLGRLLGILIVAQILFKPFTLYIMWVTTLFHK